MNPTIAHLMALAINSIYPGQEDPLKGVDIPQEYDRIMKKESKLSANLRRLVVYRYKKEYGDDTNKERTNPTPTPGNT